MITKMAIAVLGWSGMSAALGGVITIDKFSSPAGGYLYVNGPVLDLAGDGKYRTPSPSSGIGVVGVDYGNKEGGSDAQVGSVEAFAGQTQATGSFYYKGLGELGAAGLPELVWFSFELAPKAKGTVSIELDSKPLWTSEFEGTDGSWSRMQSAPFAIADLGSAKQLELRFEFHDGPYVKVDNLMLVPEPAAWATLAGLGLLGFAAYRRWRV